MCYFTWKLMLASNILWLTVALFLGKIFGYTLFIVKFIVTSKNFIYTFRIFSTTIYFILIIFILFAFYLTFVLNKTRNELKRPKTNQNEPKPAETTRNQSKRSPKNCETTRDDPKISKLGKSGIFTSFCFLNFEPKCSNLDI